MRRPLLRTAARTAVIAGTATAVSGRVARRQQERAAADIDPPASQGVAGAGGSDMIEQLKQLAALHDQGVLTDEEFAAQKAKILG